MKEDETGMDTLRHSAQRAASPICIALANCSCIIPDAVMRQLAGTAWTFTVLNRNQTHLMQGTSSSVPNSMK
jgi:hypothetical protein